MAMGALNVPAVLIVVGICVIVSNACVCIALRKTRFLKQSTYFFIIHLTVTDMALGFLILSKSCFILTEILTRTICTILLSICIALMGSSSCAIMFLYLELYLAVKNMTLFQNPLRPTQAAILQTFCIIVWIAVGATGITQQENNSQIWTYALDKCEIRWAFTSTYIIAVAGLFLFCLALTFFFQAGTVLILRSRHKQLFHHVRDDHQGGLSNVGKSHDHFEVEGVSMNAAQLIFSQKDNFKQRWLKRKMNMTKLISVVSFIFIFCWYPSIITSIVYVSNGRGNSISDAIFNWMWVMIPLHAMVNVFIYAAKSKDFRKALKDGLCACTDKAQRNQIEPVLLKQDHTPSHVM